MSCSEDQMEPGDALDSLDDAVLDVGNDANFGKPNALNLQPARDLRDVFVVRSAREYLVADHDQRGGPDSAGFSHSLALGDLARAA